MSHPDAHHPRAEAHARLEGRYTVRVLEPSPPAITAPPFHADDPTARASANDRLVVSPVSTGDLRWSEIVAAREDADLAAWCADRWLAAWRPLRASAGFARSAASVASLTRHVLGPWRAARTSGPGDDLRWTRGGIGTPFCWDDEQLRLAGRTLVWQRRGEAAGFDPDTLGEACTFARVADPGPDRADVVLDLDAIADVADWLGFATVVLEQARAEVADRPRRRLGLDPATAALAIDLGGSRVTATLEPAVLVVDGTPLLDRDALLGGEHAPVEATVRAVLAAVRRSGSARRAG